MAGILLSFMFYPFFIFIYSFFFDWVGERVG